MAKHPTRTAASKYLADGLSVLPIAKGKKWPPCEWAHLMRRHATPADCNSWWPLTTELGLGIVGGAISGNLTVLDVEKDTVWRQLEEQILAEKNLAPLLACTSLAITPRGGRHLFIHSDTAPKACAKLAYDADGELLIETRAQGGQAVAPPGEGRSWVRYFDREHRALWTGAQLGMVLELARQFHQEPSKTTTTTTPAPKPAAAPRAPGLSPIDDYNKRADFHQLLTAQGARLIRTEANGRAHYARPGKTENAAGGNLFAVDGVLRLFVHSSNWPSLQSPHSYTAFGFRLAVE